MTILVTGGMGFIGSNLIRLGLVQGKDFRIFDNLSSQIHGEIPVIPEWLKPSNVQMVRGSVTSSKDWARAIRGVDTIVHLAAETGTGQSMYEIEHYTKVNVLGTAAMLDALGQSRDHSVHRVILASSRSIYGEGAYYCPKCNAGRTTPKPRSADHLTAGRWEPQCAACTAELIAVPTRESDPPVPSSIYAATKYAQEDLVRIGCASLKIDATIFRFQNVYGEGQSLQNPYTGILSIFSTRIRRGLFLPLFEDGQESRDFVHVDDISEAMLRAIDYSGDISTAINVGSGVGSSVEVVAAELSFALGAKPNLRSTGQFRLGDIRHNVADISKLSSILGFKPSISLRDGLIRFAKWVNTQPIPEDRLDHANQELSSRGLMGEKR
jgi:dTDP-L-rhamnose 4-epimerase